MPEYYAHTAELPERKHSIETNLLETPGRQRCGMTL